MHGRDCGVWIVERCQKNAIFRFMNGLRNICPSILRRNVTYFISCDEISFWLRNNNRETKFPVYKIIAIFAKSNFNIFSYD